MGYNKSSENNDSTECPIFPDYIYENKPTQKTSRRSHPLPLGIVNIGNSCFVNVVLQVKVMSKVLKCSMYYFIPKYVT